MADEINLHFIVPGTPAAVMAEWRQERPPPLRDFEVADEAVESLVFESHYYDWVWKLMFVLTLGVALLFKGFSSSLWRVIVRFDAEGATRTKVTIVGKADEGTRAGLGELAAQHGGPVGLRVGV